LFAGEQPSPGGWSSATDGCTVAIDTELDRRWPRRPARHGAFKSAATAVALLCQALRLLLLGLGRGGGRTVFFGTRHRHGRRLLRRRGLFGRGGRGPSLLGVLPVALLPLLGSVALGFLGGLGVSEVARFLKGALRFRLRDGITSKRA
jgi:hypothetical protein